MSTETQLPLDNEKKYWSKQEVLNLLQQLKFDLHENSGVAIDEKSWNKWIEKNIK